MEGMSTAQGNANLDANSSAGLFWNSLWLEGQRGYTRTMIRNIIFDWSGTLVDDLPAVWKATNHVFVQAQRGEMSWSNSARSFACRSPILQSFCADIPLPQLETWFHASFREARIRCSAAHAQEFLDFCAGAAFAPLFEHGA